MTKSALILFNPRENERSKGRTLERLLIEAGHAGWTVAVSTGLPGPALRDSEWNSVAELGARIIGDLDSLEEFEVIHFSDSKSSPTNIPYAKVNSTLLSTKDLRTHSLARGKSKWETNWRVSPCAAPNRHIETHLSWQERLPSVPDQSLGQPDDWSEWRIVAGWDTVLRWNEPRHRAGKLSDLRIRQATMADAEVLLEWRNDSATRRASGQSQVVTWTEHLHWLSYKVESADCILLMAELNGVPIGTRRYDLLESGGWMTSTTLSPLHRGKGLALPTLLAADHAMTTILNGDVHLYCRIHESNLPSQAMNLRAGALPFLPADSAGMRTYHRLMRSRN